MNRQEWAIISHLETVFTFDRGEAVAFGFKHGKAAGRILMVRRERYDERYAEYNRIEGLSR